MSVAVEDLDEDHKISLKIMTSLREQIAKRDQAAAMRVAQGLIDHDRRHFVREERMLRECGFPGLAGHCDGHRRADAQLGALAASIACGDWLRVERLFEDVCAGFIELIADDIQYKWFLIDRGISPRFVGTRVAGWDTRAVDARADAAAQYLLKPSHTAATNTGAVAVAAAMTT